MEMVTASSCSPPAPTPPQDEELRKPTTVIVGGSPPGFARTGIKVKTQRGVNAVKGDMLADYLQGAAQDIVIDLSFHRYRAGAAPVFCNKVNFNSFLHSCSFRAVHWSVLAEPLADVETMASNARGHASDIYR